MATGNENNDPENRPMNYRQVVRLLETTLEAFTQQRQLDVEHVTETVLKTMEAMQLNPPVKIDELKTMGK